MDMYVLYAWEFLTAEDIDWNEIDRQEERM